MLRKLFSPLLVVLTTMLFGVFAPAASAQAIQTSITLAASTPTPISGEPVTVTATITVSIGSVSTLNGLKIEFTDRSSGNQFVPITNGTASAIIHPGCGSSNGCSDVIFATFPMTGDFGPSQAMMTIVAVEPGSLASGQYALLFQGKGQFGGAPSGLAAIGSMTVQGVSSGGTVTGVEDVNTGIGAYQKVPFTGSFTPDTRNLGVDDMVLQSSLGTQHLKVFLSYTQSPAQFSAAPGATFVEVDDGPLAGNGEMTLQTPSAFAGAQTAGGYVLDLAGETACSACSSFGHDAGAVFLSGQLFLEYAPQAGGGVLATETIGGQVLPTTTTNASFVEPDATGRTLFTLSPAGSATGDQPTHFVGYAIDASHFYLMSLDPHDKAILLSGRAKQQ